MPRLQPGTTSHGPRTRRRYRGPAGRQDRADGVMEVWLGSACSNAEPGGCRHRRQCSREGGFVAYTTRVQERNCLMEATNRSSELSRRAFLKTASVVAAGGVLAACGSSGSSGTSTLRRGRKAEARRPDIGRHDHRRAGRDLQPRHSSLLHRPGPDRDDVRPVAHNVARRERDCADAGRRGYPEQGPHRLAPESAKGRHVHQRQDVDGGRRNIHASKLEEPGKLCQLAHWLGYRLQRP